MLYVSSSITFSTVVQVLYLLVVSRPVLTATRTVAIDDTYGDEVTGVLPVYSPPADWTREKPCGQGDVCPVDPDPSIVRNGTWHDSVGTSASTPPRTIDLEFKGSSISVYCITSEADADVVAISNMTFELDGQEAGQFYHDVTGQRDASGTFVIHYNVEVFTATIPDGNHTLRISSVGRSRTLFDYALYTTHSDLGEANTPSSPQASSTDGQGMTITSAAKGDASSSTPNGHLSTIIGATVAGVVALVALGMLTFFLCRRRRSRSDYQAVHDDTMSISYGSANHLDDIHAISSIAHTSMATFAIETSASPPVLRAFSYSSTPRDHPPPSPEELSPSDLSLDHTHFPVPPSDLPSNLVLPRIVVTGTETRWEGPDNSTARIARQMIAEREAELARPQREFGEPPASQQVTTLPE
ncbi:hypothetical protein FKP32DRAFT_1672189 [Trametes sanguinea]|nr:hypothetical protein FKP32DRAFT_1672189 [Trametes sanguinea]